MRLAIRGEEKMEAIVHAGQEEAGTTRPQAILTISRSSGAGEEIGRAVARDLGYTYVDRDTLLADIRRTDQNGSQWARDLDEHRPSVWESTTRPIAVSRR